MEEFEIRFRLNEEIVTINEPIDGSDHLFKITNDDEYSLSYLHRLINNGFISLSNPLYCVYRIDDDGVEHEIVAAEAADTQASSQDESFQDNLARPASYNKEICSWSDAETKLLLDTYEQSMVKVGPMKQFKTKKQMWAEIAKIINNEFSISKTAIQCENRYKTVLKRKKAAVDNNSKSGNSREAISFENELNKIASIDDSIEPEVVGTSHGIRVIKRKTQPNCPENVSLNSPSTCSDIEEVNNENIVNTPSTSHVPKRRRTLTVQETLMEIFEKKEETRERRHKEKLELIREIFGSNKRENEN